MIVALVTDNTPDYLLYGSYRGWVLLDEYGVWLRNLTEAEVGAHIDWDECTNGEYARTGTLK